MTYYLTCIKMATIKKKQKISGGEDKLELLCIADGNTKRGSHCGKKYGWWFLKKLNIELPDNPAIPFLGIYPRVEAGIQADIRTPMS